MLETLRQIIHSVNTAPNLASALDLIVEQVRNSISSDVCSIYIIETADNTHNTEPAQVLMATVGLSPEAIGKVRLPLGTGLIGLVAERAEPLNLADALVHPNYQRIIETGETRFRGFLGVPIIQNRQVLGVLVVRQQAVRQFQETEVTFLFTLAAQLAGAISHAQTNGELTALNQGHTTGQLLLKGRAGNPGVGLGQGVVAYPHADLAAVPNRRIQSIEAESARLRTAMQQVADELQALKTGLQTKLPAEEQALFDALILMLDGDTLLDQTLTRIQAGAWAPAALRDTIREHAQVFEDMQDPYLRERAADIRDLGQRIFSHLQQDASLNLEYPAETVLVGEEISAMQLAEVPPDSLVGIISATGSSSSHVAILARALGVPAVMGVADMPVAGMQGRTLIVDGHRGCVYVEPNPTVCDEYQHIMVQERTLNTTLETLRGLPAETADGTPVSLLLNIGLVNALTRPQQADAMGVGLYRTELPFMTRDHFPSEDEQCHNYQRVLETFAPRPVTLRTLDIGGDKPLPYFPLQEQNPFLGWRGVRISLQHPEIFLTQIRAMLRASIGFDNMRIMLPMVTHISEVDELIQLMHRAHTELHEEGHNIPFPSIGVMIEVPSAVYQIGALAQRVDFISVGTNDLAQYLLAVDRNNPRVAELYDDLHPAVLLALQHIVAGAKQLNKPVSICGELAGNPLATPLLIGLGVDSLSMSAGSLLKVKWVMRRFHSDQARALFDQAIQQETAAQVRQLLQTTLEHQGITLNYGLLT